MRPDVVKSLSLTTRPNKRPPFDPLSYFVISCSHRSLIHSLPHAASSPLQHLHHTSIAAPTTIFLLLPHLTTSPLIMVGTRGKRNRDEEEELVALPSDEEASEEE
jgi:hypothetical protein